jgi:hypothetical protein
MGNAFNDIGILFHERKPKLFEKRHLSAFAAAKLRKKIHTPKFCCK